MRNTRNQPFCWQEKKILRLLRKKYKGNELLKLRCLYGTLTEIDSDFNQQDIKYYTKTIHTYSGLSKDWIPRGLKILADLKILTIYEEREFGKFKGKTLCFTPENIEEIPRQSIPGKPVSGDFLPGFFDTSEDSSLSEDSNVKEDNKQCVSDQEKTFFRGIKMSYLKLVHETWLYYDNLIQNKWGTFTPKIKGGVREQLLRYQNNPGELFTAIKNYSEIIESKNHYWRKRWTLWEFLTRGLENFLDESEPWDAYKDLSAGNGRKGSKRVETEQDARMRKALEERERKARSPNTSCCEVCGEEKPTLEGTFDGEGIFYCGCKIDPGREDHYN